MVKKPAIQAKRHLTFVAIGAAIIATIGSGISFLCLVHRAMTGAELAQVFSIRSNGQVMTRGRVNFMITIGLGIGVDIIFFHGN